MVENSTLSLANNMSYGNFSDKIEPLPLGVVALAPVIFIELVAAALSNTILLALVILACAHKTNNNINIYLFSLSVAGLMGTFNIFCTFLLVLARTWILDTTMCILNLVMFHISNFLLIMLYLIISRDKYIIVRNSLLTRPSKKRAYILSVVAWAVAIGIVLFSSWYPITTILNLSSANANGNFACYGFSNQRSASRSAFVIATMIFLSLWLSVTIATAASFYNFVRILIELRKLSKLRNRVSESKLKRSHAIIRVNERDRPLHITAEENTAKSLALVFFIQFLSLSVSYGMSYIQVIRHFISPVEIPDGHVFQVYFVVILVAQLFPATNPVYLILSNKRLRKRVKGLLKCELRPDLGDPRPNGGLAKKETLSKFRTRSKVFPQEV